MNERRTHDKIGRIEWTSESNSIETIHAAYTLRRARAVESVNTPLRKLGANHQSAEECYLRCWLGRNLRPLKRAAAARGTPHLTTYDLCLWKLTPALRGQRTLGDATRTFYLLDLADPGLELHLSPKPMQRARWAELVADADQENAPDWRRLKREIEEHRP